MVRKLISDCPDLALLEQKSVLALVNFHPAVDFPEPTLPNVIPVGGLQIQPSKLLSKVRISKEFRYSLNTIYIC